MESAISGQSKLNLMRITLIEFVCKVQEDLSLLTLLFQQRVHQDCFRRLKKSPLKNDYKVIFKNAFFTLNSYLLIFIFDVLLVLLESLGGQGAAIIGSSLANQFKDRQF